MPRLERYMLEEEEYVALRKIEKPRKSTDCGPLVVEATVKGDWNSRKATAQESARKAARDAAKGACEGKCPTSKSCKYLEKENHLGGQEEQVNPDTKITEYRYECTSEGTCQCE